MFLCSTEYQEEASGRRLMRPRRRFRARTDTWLKLGDLAVSVSNSLKLFWMIKAKKIS